MQELVVCVGIPASGKSTYAKQWVSIDSENRFRINRDDLRTMSGTTYTHESQSVINLTEQYMAEILIVRTGISVIIDSTNRKIDQVDFWKRLALRHGFLSLTYLIFDVPLETCIERNSTRIVNKVPEQAILALKEDYDKTVEYLTTKDLEPFEHIMFISNLK